MAKKEKISKERKKLIQEFIKSNKLKTMGDIQNAIKDLFKDTIKYNIKKITSVLCRNHLLK